MGIIPARKAKWAVGLALSAVVIGTAACGSSPSSSGSGTPLSAKQTITFAESGLGTEGQQTAKAINAFEKANPNITVKIEVLSLSVASLKGGLKGSLQ